MALSLSILLLSASILSFEIAVIRLLAISHWQPFVTLAISTALLGFGISGTLLGRFRDQAFTRMDILYPVAVMATALCYRPVAYLAGKLHLDPGLIIRDPSQWLKVGLLIMVLTLPFTLASGALALPLLKQRTVGRYYGWNFVGAAVGTAAAMAALAGLAPGHLPKVPALLAGLAAVTSLLHFRKERKHLAVGAAVIASVILLYPAEPGGYGPYKDISYTLRLPRSTIAAERIGIAGMFQVVRAPALRSAPGLSTGYRGGLPLQAGLYLAGDRRGTVVLGTGPQDEELEYLRWQTAAAPYVLADGHEKSAVAGFAGGEEIARAVIHGLKTPVIIDPDRAVPALIKGHQDLFKPWIFDPGSTSAVSDNLRSHLSRNPGLYDLIVYPAGINLAGAAAGLAGVSEGYEITVEGIESALNSLSRGGMLAITGWKRFPPAGRWKLLELFKRIQSLSKNGDFGSRVYIISGWSNYTILVRTQPFNTRELKALAAFCAEKGFTLTSGNQFPGPGKLLSDESQIWIRHLDLRPPTDNRPYPWHSLKISYLKYLWDDSREAALPMVEWGFFFIIMVLALTTVFSIISLVLSRPDPDSTGGPFFSLYFILLGAGYMAVEILLIKRSILVAGPPAVTAGVVVTSFMLSSGLGSHTAGLLMNKGHHPRWAFPGVVLLSAAAYFLIPLLLPLPFPARIMVLFPVVATPAFLMGFPFPSALMLYETEREIRLSWAWALNGYTSVIGSSLAGILAVTLGFEFLLLLGGICYLAAGIIYNSLTRSYRT